MQQITTIRVNVDRPNIPVVLYAKQHDADARKVQVFLFDGSDAYTIDPSALGIVSIAKPDGTGCYYDVDSIAGNKITFTLVEQALTAAGTAKVEISLIVEGENDSAERLTSFYFDIIIEPRVLEDSTIISSDYYNALLEALQEAVTVIRNDTYNLNLLHNADWGYCLVNQRGHTGSVASSKYCIDRWYNAGDSAGTVTPSTGSHVTLASGTVLAQKMEILPEALVGKTVTFAYSDSSDNVYQETTTFPLSTSAEAVTSTVGSLSVSIGFLSGTYRLCNISSSYVPYIKLTATAAVNIRRVWLEIGGVCHMETIPPMDYAFNLYICGRYFYRAPQVTWGHYGLGFAKGTSQVWSYFPLINTLRIRDPIVEMGLSTTNLYLNQVLALPLTVNAVRADGTSAFITFDTTGTLTDGQLYDIDARGNVPQLAISADL